MKYLVDELGEDVNARDFNGYNPVHHASPRGDNEVIRFLVERGADVTAISRMGQTTADMANGPAQRPGWRALCARSFSSGVLLVLSSAEGAIRTLTPAERDGILVQNVCTSTPPA